LANEQNKLFSKEDIQVAKKYIGKMLNFTVIREMQIKTTMNYHPTLVRMPIIQKTKK
jgi:hypothetical protein